MAPPQLHLPIANPPHLYWLRGKPHSDILASPMLATRNDCCRMRLTARRGKGRTHTLFSLSPMSSSYLYWLRALIRRDCGEKADCTTRLSLNPTPSIPHSLPLRIRGLRPRRGLGSITTTNRQCRPIYCGYAQQFLMGIDFLRQIATLPLGMPKGPIAHNGSSQ